MTQEDKELLLKDLCARLPFKVKVEAKGLLKTIADDYDNRNIINVHVLNGLNLMDGFKTYSIDCMVKVPLFNRKGICNIKPYLFPLSSMTDEQKKEIENLGYNFDNFEIHNVSECLGTYREYVTHLDCSNLIDWLNKNHFDYRGLIEKGLALDATGLNIY